MFETILVATDLTAVSEPALKAALRLGREQRAKVTVLHVSERVVRTAGRPVLVIPA
jgi:nucleotide-binding universal stress UspA family protein